jgi:predicted RNase H-like HicB family nuclease
MGEAMKRYAIVVEDAGTNLAAYVPDLPGCVATAATREELERRTQGAIKLHLEGMAEDGVPAPEPSAQVEYVEVDALPTLDSLTRRERIGPDKQGTPARAVTRWTLESELRAEVLLTQVAMSTT